MLYGTIFSKQFFNHLEKYLNMRCQIRHLDSLGGVSPKKKKKKR